LKNEAHPPPGDAPQSAQLDAFLAGLSASERRVYTTQREVAGELLRAREPPERVLEAAASALSFGDELGRRCLEVIPPAERLACREGCHWCCYLKVGATAPEVLVIAEYIRTHAPAALRERVRSRAAELSADPRVFSEYAKPEARIPCALLTETGACGVYEVRPLACRGWSSTDAEACRRALDDDALPTPTNEPLARAYAAVGLGLLAAVSDAGLAREILELTTALHIALSEPNALERWLAGDPVFAAARSGE
jgi:putative zinc- or iron-chelating protein